jgi:hypothetical protein
MQERNNLRVTLWDDIFGEAAEGGTSGAASVNDSGHAGKDAALVWMNSQAGEAFKYVGMQIDEAGCDDCSRHLDYAACCFGRNLRFDTCDLPLFNRYVLHALESGRGIYKGAALKQKIVHGSSPDIADRRLTTTV